MVLNDAKVIYSLIFFFLYESNLTALLTVSEKEVHYGINKNLFDINASWWITHILFISDLFQYCEKKSRFFRNEYIL